MKKIALLLLLVAWIIRLNTGYQIRVDTFSVSDDGQVIRASDGSKKYVIPVSSILYMEEV